VVSHSILSGNTAREIDPESDLRYYRARFFAPLTGRFTSEDPIGFSAGDVNLNRYVGNGPTNATDPSGLETFGPQAVDKMIGDFFRQLGTSLFGNAPLSPDDVTQAWISYHTTVQENNARHAAEKHRLSQLHAVLNGCDVSIGFFKEEFRYVDLPASERKWYQEEARGWRWVRVGFAPLPEGANGLTPAELEALRRRMERNYRLSAVNSSLDRDIAYNDGMYDAIVPFGTLTREGILDGKVTPDGVMGGLMDGVFVYSSLRIKDACSFTPRAGAADDALDFLDIRTPAPRSLGAAVDPRVKESRALMEGIEEIRRAIIADDALGPATEQLARRAQQRYFRRIREIFDLPEDAPIGPWSRLTDEEVLEVVNKVKGD